MRKILKIGKLSKRLLLGLLTALFLIHPALASEPIDTEKTGSLTIDNRYEKQALAGVPFSLYRVAEVAPNGQFTLLPAYTGSGAAVNDLTTAEKEQVAVKQLTAWVQTQKLSPDAQKTTDNQGTAAVSRLKTGLYLVIGEKTQIGKNIYTCSPSLVSIPEWQEETGSWNYTVTMLPKNTGKPADVPASAKPDKKPTPSSTRPNKNLPNTGILQWPIPTLAGIGVVCLLLGWQLKRKKG